MNRALLGQFDHNGSAAAGVVGRTAEFRYPREGWSTLEKPEGPALILRGGWLRPACVRLS